VGLAGGLGGQSPTFGDSEASLKNSIDGGNANQVSTRVIWGEYDFGGWQLGIGQNYGPVNFFASNQVVGSDNDMLNYGGVYGGRIPMVRFKMGGLEVALAEPNKGVGSLSDSLADLAEAEGFEVGAVDVDSVWPKLEAKYTFSVAGLLLEVGGGYNQADAVAEIDGDDEEESIDGWILYLGGKYNAGPFYFGGDIFTGKNLANYGMYVEGDASAALDEDGDVEDNDSFGWLLVVGFTMSDMIRFEGGYGWAQHDADFEEEDAVSSYYVQATINIAKGFFVVPEIGFIDFQDGPDGEDEGDTTYYGLKWQINF
jgi:hypothetical protein